MSELATRISRMLDRVQVASVTCTAWGDTGKGKIVDLLAMFFDIIARGTGGANAGHTIKVGDRTIVTHLIPSAVFHKGKTIVLGSGVAFDPILFSKEADELKELGADLRGIKISHRAHVVFPHHIALDCITDAVKGRQIGTTHKGIGPCYTDHTARIGITVNDLLNTHEFIKKLKASLDRVERYLSSFDDDALATVFNNDRIAPYVAERNALFNESRIADEYLTLAEKIEAYVEDTDQFMREAKDRKKRILLEGAQGLMLDVDYGTYPYVTSTNTGPAGLAKGVGLKESDIDLPLSIVKLYMSRVGNGPFPSELGGFASAQHCATMTRQQEQEFFSNLTVNDPEPLNQGIAIRMRAGEYGATTGRPRRIGGLDLAQLRYALPFTGSNLIITCADVLDPCHKIPIFDGYVYRGPEYRVGSLRLERGDRLDTAVPDSTVLEYCKPIAAHADGWRCPTGDARTYRQLPVEMHRVFRQVKQATGAKIAMVSVGPDREQTIVV